MVSFRSYLLSILALLTGCCSASTIPKEFVSPCALVATEDARTLLVACETANRILLINRSNATVAASVSTLEPFSGLVVSSENQVLATGGAQRGSIYSFNPQKCASVKISSTGYAPTSPVLSPDGKLLYVCNRFDNNVAVFDLAAERLVSLIPVQREPVAADVTKDGKFLLVANFLHNGRADTNYMAAVISVLDLNKGTVAKELCLPNGSGALKGVRVSPDNKFAAVTHLVGRFNRATTHLEYGWVNANALTLVDLTRLELYNTVLLDDLKTGAADPWGFAWTSDSKRIVVTLAGTHQVSIVSLPQLLAQVPPLNKAEMKAGADPNSIFRIEPWRADYLLFLSEVTRRIDLTPADKGPRSIIVVGNMAYVANYFSDTLSIVNLDDTKIPVKSIPLGSPGEATQVRKGEFFFNDAGICRDG